jgi:hypothetical protein
MLEGARRLRTRRARGPWFYRQLIASLPCNANVFEQIVGSTDRFHGEGSDVENLRRTQRAIIE